MDYVTDNTNLAYDLSRFDTSERESREKERQQDSQSVIHLAPPISLSKSGSKLKLVAVIMVFFTALLTITYFNAKSDDVARMVSDQESKLASAMADNVLLQNKLDTVVNIGYVEKYATENLGMTKLTPNQKEYLSMNTEDLIEVEQDDSDGFIGSIKKWFNSVLEYLGA